MDVATLFCNAPRPQSDATRSFFDDLARGGGGGGGDAAAAPDARAAAAHTLAADSRGRAAALCAVVDRACVDAARSDGFLELVAACCALRLAGGAAPARGLLTAQCRCWPAASSVPATGTAGDGATDSGGDTGVAAISVAPASLCADLEPLRAWLAEATQSRVRHHVCVDLAWPGGAGSGSNRSPAPSPRAAPEAGLRLRLLLLGGSDPEAAALRLAHAAGGGGFVGGGAAAGGALLPAAERAALEGCGRLLVLGLAPGEDSLHANGARLLVRQLLQACGAAAAAAAEGGAPERAKRERPPLDLAERWTPFQQHQDPVPPCNGGGDSGGCSAPRAERNLLAEALARQLAAARAEADALHVHYARLLEAVGGAQWRKDTAAMDRAAPPAAAAAAAPGGPAKGAAGGEGSSAAAAAQQQAQGGGGAAPAAAGAVPLLTAQAAAGAAAAAATASQVAAATARAREAQRALFEGQLEAARRAQLEAEERVKTSTARGYVRKGAAARVSSQGS
jgi:hypothetical protein